MQLVNVPQVLAQALRQTVEPELSESMDIAQLAIIWCEDVDDWEEVRRVGLEGMLPVVLVRSPSSHEWAMALAWGAPLIPQSASPNAITDAIRRHQNGKLCIPLSEAQIVGDAARDVLDPASGLTATDRELLAHLGRPGSYVDIALAMNVSERTIRRKVQLLRTKLGASSRSELVRHAAELGLKSN